MFEIAQRLGEIFMILGGILLVSCCLFALGFVAEMGWIAFSDTFRKICNAESLILEYRKNREKFLEWSEANSDGN